MAECLQLVLKMLSQKLGSSGQTFNASTPEAEADKTESEASMIYRVILPQNGGEGGKAAADAGGLEFVARISIVQILQKKTKNKII